MSHPPRPVLRERVGVRVRAGRAPRRSTSTAPNPHPCRKLSRSTGRGENSNMLDFLTDDVRRNPYPLYAQMRAASPLMRVPPNGPWLVFDYASVKRVLDDPETFSSSASPAGATENPLPWMIFYDPP